MNPVVAAFTAILLAALPCRAEETASPSAATPAASPRPASQAQIESKRADLAGEIALARASVESVQGGARSVLEKEVAELEKVDSLLAHQTAALDQGADVDAAKRRAADQLEQIGSVGVAEKPPYSLVQLDVARDELAAALRRKKLNTASVAAAEEALLEARDKKEQRNRERRQAKEAVEEAPESPERPALQTKYRRLKIQSRAAAEIATLRELELANEKLRLQTEELQVGTLRERVRLLSAQPGLSRSALQALVGDLEKEEFDIGRALDTARNAADVAAEQVSSAQRRLDRQSEPSAALTAEVEAHRLARRTEQRAVSLLEERLQHLAEAKRIWERRFRIARGSAERAELLEWRKEIKQWLDEAERQRRIDEARVAELTQDIDRGPGDSDDPREARWLLEQNAQLSKRVGIYRDTLESLSRTRRLQERLRGEIEAATERVPLRERLRDVWHVVQTVWSFELTAIDDRPITTGKILVGITLLAIGFLFSGFASREIGRRVLPRLGFDVSASAALESIFFYLLLVLVTLTALRLLNVPLTAFTLLGGAFAIGLGFGSQTLISNFISGLILFAERPIKVGDLIDVEGIYGTVEQIGARSTWVRSGENVHVVVPNSSFLEKNVVNFTLSDDEVRTHVSVGVAYGSPTREVARLLRQAVEEHGKVLRKPPPVILFTEFGDNSLNFEVHFWIRMRHMMDRRIVESDVRYRIDGLFREAGVTIAFPQRDVHFDARPLELRLLPPAEPAPPMSREGETSGRETK